MSAGQKDPDRASIKRKTIGRASEHFDSAPIQKALLQRHRSLCTQSTLLLCGCRTLCVLATLYFVFAPSVTLFMVAAGSISYILLLFFWILTEEKTGKEIHAVESSLARAAGGKWEDTFIQTKRPDHERNDVSLLMVKWLLRPEKALWTVMLGTVIVLRILAQSYPIFWRSL